MNVEGDEQYYAQRVRRELGLAAATVDPAAKAIHLNSAARYALLRERAVLPNAGLIDAQNQGVVSIDAPSSRMLRHGDPLILSSMANVT